MYISSARNSIISYRPNCQQSTIAFKSDETPKIKDKKDQNYITLRIEKGKFSFHHSGKGESKENEVFGFRFSNKENNEVKLAAFLDKLNDEQKEQVSEYFKKPKELTRILSIVNPEKAIKLLKIFGAENLRERTVFRGANTKDLLKDMSEKVLIETSKVLEPSEFKKLFRFDSLKSSANYLMWVAPGSHSLPPDLEPELLKTWAIMAPEETIDTIVDKMTFPKPGFFKQSMSNCYGLNLLTLGAPERFDHGLEVMDKALSLLSPNQLKRKSIDATEKLIDAMHRIKKVAKDPTYYEIIDRSKITDEELSKKLIENRKDEIPVKEEIAKDKLIKFIEEKLFPNMSVKKRGGFENRLILLKSNKF